MATIAAGLFFFSFFEYIVHRWLFHGKVKLFVQGHQSHHENPMGYDGLPFFLPALVLLGFLGAAVLIMPKGYAFLLIGTMAFGYTLYGVGHFIIHHVRFRRDLPPPLGGQSSHPSLSRRSKLRGDHAPVGHRVFYPFSTALDWVRGPDRHAVVYGMVERPQPG